MRPSKTRYQLWQIMLAIAVLAVLFAAFGVMGAVAVVVMILVAAVISLPILLAGLGRRVRAAVLVASVYPFVILASLYSTWLIAWWILGHPPRPYTDGPGGISPIVNVMRVATWILLAVGAPLIWFVYVPAIIVVANASRKGMRAGEGILQLLVLLGAWLTAFVIAWWDPGQILKWCFQ